MRNVLLSFACVTLFSAGCATEERYNSDVPVSGLIEPAPPETKPYQQPQNMDQLRILKGQIAITTNRENSLYLRADRDLNEVAAIRVGVQDAQAIKVGKEPISIVLNSEEKFAYVSNLGDGTVSVIDLASLEVTNTIEIGANLFCLVFSRGEKYLYVVSRFGEKVWIVDPVVNSVVGTTKIHQMDLDVKKTQCYSGCHKMDPQRQRTFESIRHAQVARIEGLDPRVEITGR